jgi:hypothetical protein
MTGKPGKDARAALRQSSVIIPIIVVILGGTLLFWIFHFRLP